MRKTIVLDTSVLVTDPSSYKSFAHCDVIIPIVVLNELDKLKKQSDGAGKNARVSIRLIDELSSLGDISVGILIDNDIFIRVDAEHIDTTTSQYSGFGDPAYGDTQILACAYLNFLSHPTNDVTLVSNDINLRIKAKARGMGAQSYEEHNYSFTDLFAGNQTFIHEEAGLELQKFGHINPQFFDLNLHHNECVMFENENGDGIAMGRKVSDDKVKLVKKYYPWGISCRNKEQTFAVDLMMDKNVDLVTLIGKAGTGKSLMVLAAALELVINQKAYDKFIIYRPIQAVGNDIGYLPGPQPLDAKIVTPDGWKTMGEIIPGMKVIGRDGLATKVLNIFPKGNKKVYKLTTSDGTSTECCEDHLWSVTHNNENKIVSTKIIIDSLDKNKYYLPRNLPVHFSKKQLLIPPYSLGALLGDGSVTDNHVTYYTKDNEVIERVVSELSKFDCNVVNSNINKLSYRFYPKIQYGKRGAKSVKITNVTNGDSTTYDCISKAAKTMNMRAGSISRNCNKNKQISGFTYTYINKKMVSSHPIIRELLSLNLFNKKSYDKFIPKIYLQSSIEDRIDLLRGLMDTDGTIKNNGEMSFCTTSLKLANDMVELVQSLGGRATIHERNRIGKSNIINGVKIIAKRVSYEFTISLPGEINPFFLKRKANRHNKNKNPSKISIKSIDFVGEKEVQCILVENPEHLYLTDNFIVTHNTMEEKLGPWFQAILDNFEHLFTSKNGDNWKRELEMYQKKGKIEMEAITYIRGRSIPKAIILVDECQNLTKEDVKTILTRAGEGTKIILTGDIEQIDNTSLDALSNGLTHVIEKFKHSGLAGHITFTKGERSRLATTAAEIL